jgi:hypothetical protein
VVAGWFKNDDRSCFGHIADSSQLFIGVHNEMRYVVAMRVHDPGRSPVGQALHHVSVRKRIESLSNSLLLDTRLVFAGTSTPVLALERWPYNADSNTAVGTAAMLLKA